MPRISTRHQLILILSAQLANNSSVTIEEIIFHTQNSVSRSRYDVPAVQGPSSCCQHTPSNFLMKSLSTTHMPNLVSNASTCLPSSTPRLHDKSATDRDKASRPQRKRRVQTSADISGQSAATQEPSRNLRISIGKIIDGFPWFSLGECTRVRALRAGWR
jgi:hypothetical protein